MSSSKVKQQDLPHDGIVEDRRTPPPWYFSLLFYGLIVWGLGYCGYYLLGGWSSSGEYAQEQKAFTQAHPAAK